MKCKNCGTTIKVEKNEKVVKCPKCNMVFAIKGEKDGRVK